LFPAISPPLAGLSSVVPGIGFPMYYDCFKDPAVLFN
jgi:hypothetical protein